MTSQRDISRDGYDVALPVAGANRRYLSGCNPRYESAVANLFLIRRP